MEKPQACRQGRSAPRPPLAGSCNPGLQRAWRGPKRNRGLSGELNVEAGQSRRGCGRAWWPVTTMVPDAGGGERPSRPPAGSAACREQRHQLVRSAHAARPAGGKATMWTLGLTAGEAAISRGCGRSNFHQKPADTHAGNIAGGYIQAGNQTVEHPVKTVFLGAPGATGRADHRYVAEFSEHQQVPGSTGMPARRTSPPACLMADGITSSKSQSADARRR